MTCFHPLIGKVLNPLSKGKKHIKIYKRDNVDPLLLSSDNAFIDYIPIPCGRCQGCRIEKARDWSIRLLCESYTSTSSYFLTLTYDSDHFGSSLSLDKEDFRGFIKRLRNYYYYKYGVDNIKFFGSGEYGAFSGRKHLHIILFNCPINDLTPYMSKNGNIYHVSKEINDIWEKGYVIIGEVTPESASYVARYTLKKQYIKDTKEVLTPPFLLMSTNPGIGYTYWSQHKDELFKNWSIFYDHHEASLPKYYKELFKKDPYYSELVYDKLKDISDKAFDHMFYVYVTTPGLSYKEILNSKELILESNLKNKGGSL